MIKTASFQKKVAVFYNWNPEIVKECPIASRIERSAYRTCYYPRLKPWATDAELGTQNCFYRTGYAFSSRSTASGR